MGLLDWLFGPPQPDAYARMVLARLARAGDPRQMTYDRENFALNYVEQGQPASVPLRMMYDEYCGLPRSKRPDHLKLVIRGLLSYQKELPEEYEDARPDLLPIVRTRSFFELLQLAQELKGLPEPDIPYQEIGDHLLVNVVYDLPESMRSISRETLDRWGVGFYEALEAARANLEGMQFAFASLGTQVYASVTGDNYDASRLLLFDFVENLEIDGDPVAMIPNRDTLLITGSEDAEGLMMVAELAERALEKSQSISAIPLKYSGGEWVTWQPEPDHPTAGKFRLLEIKSLFGDYAEQKSLLDALHQKKGADLVVAHYSVAETKKGRVHSTTIWREDVESLLPESHEIVFVSHAEQRMVARGAWDRVREIVGDLMKPTDLYPRRYLVTEFPTERQLARIGIGSGEER